MKTLTIVGLCLLAPFLFLTISSFIDIMINIFNNGDTVEFIFIFSALLAFVGSVLLIISL